MSDTTFDWRRPAELEARTDELLRKLDELNQRVERTLAEILPPVTSDRVDAAP